MNRADRVFLRLVGLTLQRRLAPAYFSLLLAVGLADPMIDWNLLREQLRAQAPLISSLQVAFIVCGWSLTSAAALAPVWRDPSARYLTRQPLGRVPRARYLLPSLTPAMIPIVLAWWLTPMEGVLGLFALIACAVSLTLGSSQGAVHTLILSLLATPAIVALALTWLLPLPFGVRLVAALGTIASVPAACGLVRARGNTAHRPGARSLCAPTPTLAILRRDLLCLTRQAPSQLRQLLVIALLAGAFLVALKVNGDFAGRDLHRAACVLLMLSLLTLYEILVRLQSKLGAQLARRHWPITRAERANSLLALGAVLTLPSVLVLTLTGLSMGPGWLGLLWLYALTMVMVQCALFAASGSRASPAHGWSLWAWLLGVLLVCVLSPVAFVLTALAAMAAAWIALLRGLDRLTQDGALGRLEGKEA